MATKKKSAKRSMKKASAKKAQPSLASHITHQIATTKLSNKEIAQRLLNNKALKALMKTPLLESQTRNIAWYRSRMNSGKIAAGTSNSSSPTWNPKKKGKR